MNPKLFVGTRITVLVFPGHHRGGDISERVPMRGTVVGGVGVHISVIDSITGRIEWRQDNGSFGPWLRPHLEGIEWIRGWHNEKSEEVLALLAAAALVSE